MMQGKQSIWKRISDRGYYIALGVCVAAVAVSGWLFVRSLRADEEPAPVNYGTQTVMLPTLPELWAAKDAPAAAMQTVPAPARTEPQQQSEPPETHETPTRSVITRPVDGAVSAAYSMEQLRYNETTKDWRTHAGMDIAAAEGSDVVAAADGKVLAVYEDDLLGQTVTVEHAGGVVTHYANLAEDPAVSAGDEVKSGDLLGKVGRTALVELADEPHLHFAVYRNNVPQDPAEFLGGE